MWFICDAIVSIFLWKFCYIQKLNSNIFLLFHIFSDLRSCKQRQRYFSFFCNKRIMVAWSVQSNSSRSYLYSSSSTIFVIHHYDYPHKLYINDNAVIALYRINRVSLSFYSYMDSMLLFILYTINESNHLLNRILFLSPWLLISKIN